ncbi:hypothetical protein L917_15418, partial [Phytophthora nicotianae]
VARSRRVGGRFLEAMIVAFGAALGIHERVFGENTIRLV